MVRLVFNILAGDVTTFNPFVELIYFKFKLLELIYFITLDLSFLSNKLLNVVLTSCEINPYKNNGCLSSIVANV